MTKNTIFVTIQKGFANLLNVATEAITLETRLKEDLNVDSMFLFESAMKLEEDFGIEIPEEDMPKLTSIQEIVEYVAQRLQEKA